MHSQLALTEHAALNLAPLTLLDPVHFCTAQLTCFLRYSKVSYIFNVSGGGEQRNERRRREKCDAAASVIVVLQHREELYGKLLRAGGAAAADLKSRLMGLGGEDCFLLRNPKHCTEKKSQMGI